MIKNKVEVFTEMNTGDIIESGYYEFGKEVNQNRSIPFIYDGLKPVARHVIQSSYELPNKMTKVLAVASDAIKKYHFTGDASVYPVVSDLVLAGIFLGQGNHGNLVLRGQDDPPAAPRYIESMLNPVFREHLDMLSKYVESNPTATGYDELKFIPTPIPLSLVFGNQGIGLGIDTRIPAFTLKSLYEAFIKDDYKKLKLNYGYMTSDLKGLKALWDKGIGSLKIEIPVTPMTIEGESGFLISCTPQSFKPNWKTLETWEDSGWISIEDISDETPKMFVRRNKRIRTIDDNKLEKEIRKACTVVKSFAINVYDGQITGTVGIKNWITKTHDLYVSLFDKYRADNIKRLNFDILVWTHFRAIAEKLIEKNPMSDKDISNELNKLNTQKLSAKDKKAYVPLTEAHVASVGKKSLNTLRNSDPTAKLKEVLNELDKFNMLDTEKEIKRLITSWTMV